MENSNIEWTDHTFNPWIGCTKVSPGCANCYAETLDDKRFSKTLGGATKAAPVSHWGPGAPRHRTSAAMWRQPLRWDREAAQAYLDAYADRVNNGYACDYRRPRVFCASLADWLDDEVPVEWLADLLDLIRRTPNLDWLLLTKRPENWHSRMRSVLDRHENRAPTIVCAWLNGLPPANVWIGTTVEDQKRADERIPVLLSIPARVRFLSCEPLLGPVDLNYAGAMNPLHGGTPGGERIHWVICGGESGAKARPMHPAWARSLRDQCKAAGVAFFFKQWGEWVAGKITDGNGPVTPQDVHVDGKPAKAVHDWGDEYFAVKTGKAMAGRLLDGVEHSEFPEVRHA